MRAKLHDCCVLALELKPGLKLELCRGQGSRARWTAWEGVCAGRRGRFIASPVSTTLHGMRLKALALAECEASDAYVFMCVEQVSK